MTTSPSFFSSKQFYFALLLTLALVMGFAFQGSRGLYETTEGRYAEVAREMLDTGGYFEPTLGYEPHWTKPPLTYWAIVGGMKVLGQNEWGVRFYLAVTFVLTVLIVSLIATALWGETTGLIAGLVYVSSPFPVLGCNAVSTDALLTLWELSAVLCYLKAIAPNAPGRKLAWILLMWLGWALAFFTKGPPALLPLFPILIWHFRNGKQAPLLHPLGLILFAAGGLSWYVVESLRHPDLFSYFLGRELIQRALYEEDRNPQWHKPFTFYLPVLTVGAGAWFYYSASLFIGKRLFNPKRVFREILKPGMGSFLLLWLLIPLVIFFIVKSRLLLYVLPLYAPIALAVAGYIASRGKEAVSLRKIAIIAIVSVAILVAGKGIASYRPSKFDMRNAAELYRQAGIEKSVLVLVNQSHGYGLDFYLRRPVKRLHTTHGDGRPSLGTVLKEIKSKPKSDTYAFMVPAQKAKKLYRKP